MRQVLGAALTPWNRFIRFSLMMPASSSNFVWRFFIKLKAKMAGIASQSPTSELAKPAVAPLDSPITLHVTQEDTVIIGGQEVSVEGLKPFLDREASVLTMRGKAPSSATIIIRGDMDARTITVQDVIKTCQLAKFEKFVLRAKEERGY